MEFAMLYGSSVSCLVAKVSRVLSTIPQHKVDVFCVPFQKKQDMFATMQIVRLFPL